MTALEKILSPLDRGDGRTTAVDVYAALERSILNGQLQPGAILSQVKVANALNVSRTPVREAMRMLQEGGLLEGEPNHRSRVVGFDPNDIEALYTKRLVLEALGVSMTARRTSPEWQAELKTIVVALESDEAHRNFARWQEAHRRFHQLIVAKAGSALVTELEQLERRSERYQSAYKGAHMVGWWQRGEAEHRELVDAMTKGEAARAGGLAARHLARTALELLAALAPEFDAAKLRSALAFAIAGASAS